MDTDQDSSRRFWLEFLNFLFLMIWTSRFQSRVQNASLLFLALTVISPTLISFSFCFGNNEMLTPRIQNRPFRAENPQEKFLFILLLILRSFLWRSGVLWESRHQREVRGWGKAPWETEFIKVG